MDGTGDIKGHVKKRYGEIARREECGCSCCGGGDTLEQARGIGYSDEDLAAIPGEAALGLGCGNPAALAGLREGETVLDLGSGSGIDVFLASRKVGRSGRVIGVDMTPDMVERANALAAEHGYGNVEFRLGEIEDLPLGDGSVDVVISNCVINLTTDKPASYREIFRVLRPGGRLLVSDIVTAGDLPADVRADLDSWAQCIAGAIDRDAYLGVIRGAGFEEIRVVSEKAYGGEGADPRVAGKVLSISVEAHRKG